LGAEALRADRVVADALALVAEVRQLPAKAKVPGVRLDREALGKEVTRLLDDDSPAELVTGNTEVLFALGSVPHDFDLREAVALLFSSELAGFYDPKLGRMVLASDLGEEMEQITLYHELVHALQDQHFDLDHAFDWKAEQSDVQGALHALAEGDATSAMTEVFAKAAGVQVPPVSPALLQANSLLLQASPKLARVPPIITRSMLVPYVDGLSFVNALRARGGFAAVDAAFRSPPLSTEQVLHPEKYLSGEPVVAVPAIAPPPGFVAASFRDVLGEQGLRLLFEEWAPAAAAREAASGWGGDRIAVFSEGERRVALWHLAFDDENAARRAAGNLARGALREEAPDRFRDPAQPRPFVSASDAETAVRAGHVCRMRQQRGAFAFVRHGSRIGVTLGPYQRGKSAPRSAGDCAQAVTWARRLVQ
jgi:hypothetical protein